MRDKLATKRKIVAGMIKLMDTMAYRDITVKEICQETGVSRMTYYRNFHDKKELLTYHFDGLFTDFIQQVSSSHSRTFFDIATIFFNLIKADQHFMELLIQNDLTIVLRERLRYYIGGLVDQRVLRVRERSSKLLISMISGGLTELLITWTQDGMQEPVESLVIFASKYMHFKN
ncbi:TetR/AcrR family transcriptional regulator [Nicoliella spurrieriana]|uniref:TetR/AcrR family transcriptional regulator n=1 Tax=Nicoliella spurrieriana TaxID=2925830 RepID=A0A976RT93_9LACO|nr:TetR/AcrR family transcriptional regulator [Nicoliella spurrieriana]UQS87460.1 TetR/AcrR family transcriptional regulator [Nicoliella spurrieriana]